MQKQWSNSIVLVETRDGKVKITISNADNTNDSIEFSIPSDVAIDFAEVILTHAVMIEDEIDQAVRKLTELE